MHIECTGEYWLGSEDSRDYNLTWSTPLTGDVQVDSAWKYWSSWQLKTLPITGKLATYSGGGYVITMPIDAALHNGSLHVSL